MGKYKTTSLKIGRKKVYKGVKLQNASRSNSKTQTANEK